MSLPTQDDIQLQKTTAEHEIARLQHAYEQLEIALGDLGKEEQALLLQLRTMLDRRHLHRVLTTIDAIKE